MKTFLFFASFSAAFLAVSLNQDSAYAQGPRIASSQSPGTNVAVIDMSYVFKNNLRFKKAIEDIKKDAEAFDAHGRQEQARGTKIKEKMAEFNAGTPEYRRLEEDLARLISDLQVQRQLKGKGLAEQEAKIYYNSYNEVFDHISDFARRNGIGLVLRYSSEKMDPAIPNSVVKGVNRAIVFQDRLDITEQILDRVNRGVAPANVGTRQQQIPRRKTNR